MNGDDEKPDPQEAIERQLLPLVLADFERIAGIAAEFVKIHSRRVEALLRNENVPEETERACEGARRELAMLMANIYLNELRIEQLTTQIRDLAGRLAQGDAEAVITESRMSPDELRRLAASVGESDPEAAPIESASAKTARILASLTPREERVLRERFGIGINTDGTLEDVGRQFSVTRERIRQIEAKAIRKLKGKAGRTKPASTQSTDRTTRENGHAGAKLFGADTGKPIESGWRIPVEIGSNRRTETGGKPAIMALYESPLTMDAILQWRECLRQGVMRLRDVIDLDATYSAYHPGGGAAGKDDEDKDE